MEKQITIKRDGLSLHGLIDLPEQDEFDLVILMHGFTSDLGYTKCRVFYDLTPALRKKGSVLSALILTDMVKVRARFQK